VEQGMESIGFLALPLVGTAAGKGTPAGRERQSVARFLMGALILAAVLMLGSRPARAQNTGSIFGTVQDATGAVIPGAEVTAADATHGVTRTVKSNGSGEYLLSNLPVGVYMLTVTSPQFEAHVVTNITVDANANVKEVVSLQAGSAKETVTVVDSSGSVIDANSATLGTLIDTKLIEDLPIDGHNAVALSALLPGVVSVNAPTTSTGDTNGPTYSASGSRTTQNLMLFDGLMWNNLFYNTGIAYPPPNALNEISVLLNNYKAEYGRNAGSVFNVITKSGTNALHGSVWDYIQNSYFNASDYISKVNPKDNIDQMGFQIGGPIIKDKLYFSGAFQDLIGRLQNTGSVTPLGYAERGLLPGDPLNHAPDRPCATAGPFPGDNCFSFAPDVTLGKLTNPLSAIGTSSSGAQASDAINMITSAGQQAGTPGISQACVNLLTLAQTYAASYINVAGGNKIQQTYMPNAEFPIECMNPVMQNVFLHFIPVVASAGQTLAATSSPLPESDKNLLARMDYPMNGQHSFDARYNMISTSAQSPLGVNSSSQGIASYAVLSMAAKSNYGNVGWNWVISPSLMNAMRFGYKRYEYTQFPQDHRTLNDFGGNFVETGIPTLPAFGFSGAFNLGSTSQGFRDNINENVELNEALTWSKGNHNIKVGFQFLRLQYLTRQDYPGQISFGTTFTGAGLAEASLGLTSSITAQNRLNQGGIQHDVFTYLQDDWRATPRLTVNFGLRYELPFQWFQPQGEASTFIPGMQSTVFPTAPGGLGFPGDKGVLPSLVPTDFNGIAPRLGFAYDATGEGKLLIRGGFGIFFDAVNANVIGVGEPYHYIFNHLLPPGGASVPLAGFGPNGTVQVVPGAFDPKNPQFVAPYSIFYPDKNFRTPYVEAVNLGFQWHVAHAGTLEVNYVSKLARKLTIPLDLNPAIYDCSGGYYQSNPSTYCTNASNGPTSNAARVRYAPFNYGGQGIVDIMSVGTSNYNALQEQYTQRGGRYLTIFQSYTYSRSLDIQTNALTTSNVVPNVFNLNSDYGPSDNNAPQILTLGWVMRFPKATSGSALVRQVLNNWIYSGSYQAHSGRPFSVTQNADIALDAETNQRAAILPGVNPHLSSSRHRADKVNKYFNRDAFTYPAPGTFSNVGRNAFVGPGYIMTDMTVGRDFPLARVRQGMRLNVRAEAYNVFNTPNLANPTASFSCQSTSLYTSLSPFTPESCTDKGSSYGSINPATGLSQFGQILSTYGNNANTSTNGRKMQFAMTVFY
jgi:outer membrane receptor protein involved in Fe transport